MGALEKTRQELDTTKLHLSSTQQSLHERDRHLNSLRQERRKQLEEILEMKLVSHCTAFKTKIYPTYLLFIFYQSSHDDRPRRCTITNAKTWTLIAMNPSLTFVLMLNW